MELTFTSPNPHCKGKTEMKLDEKWIRAHLPPEAADQPIDDLFSCEYLDGLTVMQEGEHDGDGIEEPRPGSVIRTVD